MYKNFAVSLILTIVVTRGIGDCSSINNASEVWTNSIRSLWLMSSTATYSSELVSYLWLSESSSSTVSAPTAPSPLASTLSSTRTVLTSGLESTLQSLQLRPLTLPTSRLKTSNVLRMQAVFWFPLTQTRLLIRILPKTGCKFNSREQRKMQNRHQFILCGSSHVLVRSSRCPFLQKWADQ